MVQLIKKGGLRERANRSRAYQGSENTETTLAPNRYRQPPVHQEKTAHVAETVTSTTHSMPAVDIQRNQP